MRTIFSVVLTLLCFFATITSAQQPTLADQPVDLEAQIVALQAELAALKKRLLKSQSQQVEELPVPPADPEPIRLLPARPELPRVGSSTQGQQVPPQPIFEAPVSDALPPPIPNRPQPTLPQHHSSRALPTGPLLPSQMTPQMVPAPVIVEVPAVFGPAPPVFVYPPPFRPDGVYIGNGRVNISVGGFNFGFNSRGGGKKRKGRR